jgi:hypothetical protein
MTFKALLAGFEFELALSMECAWPAIETPLEWLRE